MTEFVLEVKGLQAWYGESQALHGMDFTVKRGEIVSLIGRNGAGKSTTLKSIMGLEARRTGSVIFEGTETIQMPTNKIARSGIAYCPEERGIFGSLSVEENLMLPPIVRDGGMTVPEIYELFPNLSERRTSRGTELSGGEQQMLAIARILRTGANLLLLDEPTEGLAPVIVKAIGSIIRSIRDRGFSIVLVEQNYRFAARCANRHNIVVDGKIVEQLGQVTGDDDIEHIKSYLSV